MYVSRYVSRLLVPSSVINSAKREVFINRQKQVGEKQVEIKIVIPREIKIVIPVNYYLDFHLFFYHLFLPVYKNLPFSTVYY